MKKIDALLFEQIDTFKSSAVYIKFVEVLNSIPRDQRLILNQAATLFLIFFPFLVLAVVFSGNHKLRNRLNSKNQILKIGNEIVAQQRELEGAKRSLFTYPAIKNKGDLDLKIRNTLSKFNINLNNVSTQNFQLDASFPGVFRTSATVQFSKLSTNQLMDIFTHITGFEKMKVDNLSIIKDPADGLLKGNFQAVLYGEESNVEESYE